jgi:hypothetical protein
MNSTTWRTRLGIASVAALMMSGAGCTGSAHELSGGGSSRQAVTSTPLTSFGTRQTSLGCLDAVGVPADQGPVEDPIQVLLAKTNPALPRAEDVGVRLPVGLHWYLRKDPLALPAGAPDLTLSVAGVGQALGWVPSSVWTTGGPPDLGPWAASSVTLHSCPDRAVLFLGGMLAADLSTCINLTIRQEGRPERTVHQLLDGSACT